MCKQLTHIWCIQQMMSVTFARPVRVSYNVLVSGVGCPQ